MINYTLQIEKTTELAASLTNSFLSHFQGFSVITTPILIQKIPIAWTKRIAYYLTEPILLAWKSAWIDSAHPKATQSFLQWQEVSIEQLCFPISQLPRLLQKAIEDWLYITAQPIPYLTKFYFPSPTHSFVLPLSQLQITTTYWAEFEACLDLMIKYLEKNYQKEIDRLLFEAKLYKISTLLQEKGQLIDVATWWETHSGINPVQYGAWLLETPTVHIQHQQILQQHIPIQQQFEFITHIFNGNRDLYLETLAYTEQHSYAEAEKYVIHYLTKNQMSSEDGVVQQFLSVMRNFAKS